MNEIFSSRVFVVKLERSRKLRVDIGSDEKKEREGRVDGVGRFAKERVKSDRKRPISLRQTINPINTRAYDLADLCPVY